MKQYAMVMMVGLLAGCTSAAEQDREHYAQDNALRAQCERLAYVEGTRAFKQCYSRLLERLDHTPYHANEHSYPPRR